MNKINHLLFRLTMSLICAALLAGCGNSPEKARVKLGQTGLQFTADDFIRKAVGNNDAVAAKLFLDAGMDANATIQNEHSGTRTALAIAAEKGYPEMAQLLLTHGARVTNELVNAASGGNLETVKLLIQHGAQTTMGWDIATQWGKTPLFIAVYRGNSDVVDYLLKNNVYDPKFEFITTYDYQDSFMGAAIFQRQVEVVKVLIDHKINCSTAESIRQALDNAKQFTEILPSGSAGKVTENDVEKSQKILDLLTKAFPKGTP